MLGQPVSMLIPEVVGFKLTGRLREGITATDLVLTRHPDAAQAGVVGSSSNSMATARPSSRRRPRDRSPTWRPNMARPAASSRSTTKRSPICATPAATRHGSPWSKPMPRRKACGATQSAEPVFTDTLELDMLDRASFGPKRPQDRSPEPAQTSNRGTRQEDGEDAATRAFAVEWIELSRRRRRRDRRDHQLHQHLQPSRDDRGGPGRAQGPRARPDTAAVGQDRRSRPAPGGERVSRRRRPADELDALGFDMVGYGCTTCIGNSGPLAERDHQGDRTTHDRSRPRCCRGTATSKAASTPT